MNHYALALGSNRGHGRAGRPAAMIARAITALAAAGIAVVREAPVISSAPIGPSRRRYANSAVLVVTEMPPDQLLSVLKGIERELGRRRGQRWGSRSIDIDIILWSGGQWQSRRLTIPHPQWRRRAFVLAPLSRIAAAWRDPATGRTVRQLAAIHRRPRAIR